MIAGWGWISATRLFLDPSHLEMVFEMDRALSGPMTRDQIAALRKHERARVALATRPRLRIDVSALAAMPEGSLGREFAEFLRRNELDPQSIPTLPATNDDEYVSAHLYETHDLWHVVTGFPADVAGELGLQAVYAATFGGKLAMLIVGGGLLQAAMRAPGDFARRIDMVVAGWSIGREGRLLFGVPWDRLWERPLVDVRRELGIRAAS